MTICYTLDNKWDNIHKVFLTRESTPHLVFSSKPHYEVIQMCNLKNDLYNVSYDINELDNVITYMIHNKDQTDYRKVDNNLVQYLVGKNKTDELCDILKMYDVDLSDVDNLLEISVINSNAKQVKILMDRKFDSSKSLLENNIKKLELTNSLLYRESESTKSLNKDLAIINENLTLTNNSLSKEYNKLVNETFIATFKSNIYMALLFFGMIFAYFL